MRVGGAAHFPSKLTLRYLPGADGGKLITVFHPPGKYAHATFGFVGFWGALAGEIAHLACQVAL